MGKVANIIGSTGLVGHQLLTQILDHPEFQKVRIFVRRATGIVHPKLEEKIIDFDQTESWKPLVTGDVLFSTLGTTIKTAKTKENQFRVDFTYQFEFAKAAAENGVSVYLLVSSMGANPKSSVFYSRMKGELEDAVAKLPFQKLFIIRPSILDGDRQEKRAGEKFGLILSRFVTRFILKVYKPTPVDLLASKMISLSLEKVPGVRTIGGFELFQN
jgi:uncharacterized protein YbjT (DUF2867 family)